MQSQLVCSGCRNVLLYPRGAANVCCAVCNTVTSATHAGIEMAQLVCGGCRTLLMHAPGATSVRCSCCQTINIARMGHQIANQVAHVNCGQCHITLMYPYGAPSVKCAVCNYITNVGTSNMRIPIPVHGSNGSVPTPPAPPISALQPHAHSHTVVVENPMTVDESGKLVSNLVVGVTTEKK